MSKLITYLIYEAIERRLPPLRVRHGRIRTARRVLAAVSTAVTQSHYHEVVLASSRVLS